MPSPLLWLNNLLIFIQVVALVPLLGQLASMTVILSVLTYYRRLSPARSFHILCYTVMAITVFNGTFRCTLGLIWCFHIDTGPGFCPNQNLVGLINVSIVIGLSFFIWCMPIPLLWKLKRASVLKRLALIATFCVGLIATIACASRFLVMNEAKKAKDPPWVSPWLFIIAQVEVCAGLIAASLPTLRPLWSRKPWSTSSGGGSLPGAKLKHMEERVDSGAGTKVLARAQAGWEVVSLTATWQGVQRYYHTRWGGRKRSIIEVMEIPGLGVLDQHLDNPFLHSTFAEERGIVAGNGVDTLTVASTAEGTLPYSSSGNSTRSLVPPPAEINHRRTSSGDSSRGGSTPIPPPPQQDATIREQEASEPGDVQPPESVETTPIAQSAAS